MLFHRLWAYWSAQQKDSLWVSAFILLLALLPLPFGGNRPWASDLLAVLSGLLLVNMLWAERNVEFISGNALRKRILTSAALFTFVVIWGFIQIIPWVPTGWQHPLWNEAANVLGPLKGSISVDPGRFPESLLRLASYVAAFLLAYGACRNAQNAKRLVHMLALAGVLYALYGIIVESTGSNMILWYKKWAYEGFVTSTFVNKNSYATYAGLSLLCCMTFLFHHFGSFVPKDPVLARSSKTMAIIASLGIRDYAYILCPILLIAALALTGSRGGTISTLLGSTAFLAAFAAHKKWKIRHWFSLLIVAGLLFLAFVGIGGETFLLRVDEQAIHNDAAMRAAGYKLTMQALHDNPWLGFGLGTFDSAFRLYRDASLPLWFHHAHNDYLEMMMDLGIPSACLLFAAMGLMISCTITGIRRRRRDGVYPALAIGASVLVGTHALFDFSMHIPAIAATYAAILGVGVAQSTSSRSSAHASEAATNKQERTRIHGNETKGHMRTTSAQSHVKPAPQMATPKPTPPLRQDKPSLSSAAATLTQAQSHHPIAAPIEIAPVTPAVQPATATEGPKPLADVATEAMIQPTEPTTPEALPEKPAGEKTKKRKKQHKKKK
ncbi:MAG: O-antigen ligase family protein [Alphaproteobacteria bacterium]|nr:O-antigen ligase family protein [Alphaproteobacteria bacterium]